MKACCSEGFSHDRPSLWWVSPRHSLLVLGPRRPTPPAGLHCAVEAASRQQPLGPVQVQRMVVQQMQNSTCQSSIQTYPEMPAYASRSPAALAAALLFCRPHGRPHLHGVKMGCGSEQQRSCMMRKRMQPIAGNWFVPLSPASRSSSAAVACCSVMFV